MTDVRSSAKTAAPAGNTPDRRLNSLSAGELGHVSACLGSAADNPVSLWPGLREDQDQDTSAVGSGLVGKPASPPLGQAHIPASWITLARGYGQMAAHGEYDRGQFETLLGSLCRLQPGLRGGSVDVLVWFYEQARDAEDARLQTAAYRVQLAVWPLFRVPPVSAGAVIAAATAANQGVLSEHELDHVISMTCERAMPPRKRP